MHASQCRETANTLTMPAHQASSAVLAGSCILNCRCEEHLVSDPEGVREGGRCQWSGRITAIRAKRTRGSRSKEHNSLADIVSGSQVNDVEFVEMVDGWRSGSWEQEALRQAGLDFQFQVMLDIDY
jgi:hypothetical protein